MERINGDRDDNFHEGDRGYVSFISENGKNVSVDIDDGYHSTGNAPHKLKVIESIKMTETKKNTFELLEGTIMQRVFCHF